MAKNMESGHFIKNLKECAWIYRYLKTISTVFYVYRIELQMIDIGSIKDGNGIRLYFYL